MSIATKLGEIIGYLSDAVAKIFGTDRNKYPNVGVQPYEGEIDREKS